MSTSNFKIYTTFNKLLLLLENALKLNFEAENLNPLQGQPPTHSDPIIKMSFGHICTPSHRPWTEA